MQYEYTTFKPDYIADAAGLFAANYAEARKNCRHLPEYDIGAVIREALLPLQKQHGVAVFHGGKLAAYMISGPSFTFKSQQAVMLPEFCHAAEKAGRDELYRRMYMDLAADLVRKGSHFERLFVEHETANYYGGRFWVAHFQVYLNYAMRYIDTMI